MEKEDSAFDIITEGLVSIGGWQKRTADHIMIKCPFHSDGTPSLGIYVASGMELPIGSWHCFGCGAKGGWNKIAAKLGLRTIKEWNDYNNTILSNSIEDDITLESMARQMRVQYAEWPQDMEWRGFEGSFVRKIGGLIAAELTGKIHTNRVSALFPVYVNRVLKGGIKAALKKQPGVLPYVATKGNWVKNYGVLGYNITKRMNKGYTVLVEGPRDATRLIYHGIPAIAIMGSNNFGAQKALTISSLPINTVFCLPDNDEAGRHMKIHVKKYMTNYTKTISIRLPEHCNDPEEMNDDDIDALKDIIHHAT